MGKALGPGRLATWATRGNGLLPGIGKPISRFLFRHGFGNDVKALAQLGTMRSGTGALLNESVVRQATDLAPCWHV